MTREEATWILSSMISDFGKLGVAKEMAIQALQEQKVGKWKKDIDFGGHTHYYCSLCNSEGWHTDKFCSECGSKMEGADNE